MVRRGELFKERETLHESLALTPYLLVAVLPQRHCPHTPLQFLPKAMAAYKREHESLFPWLKAF